MISFGANREYSFAVHEQDIQDISKADARDWLANEFEELECVPSNPVGKILLLDMVLNVAKYGGEERFKAHDEWAQHFAKVVAVALKRSVIHIDIQEQTVA